MHRQGLKTVLDCEVERSFQAEGEKVLFLGGLLEMHRKLGDEEWEGYVEYDYEVMTPDGRRLYSGCFRGTPAGGCDGMTLPMEKVFVQNLVCTRQLLEIPEGGEGLELFDDGLLGYAEDVQAKGFIENPADFIERLKTGFEAVWKPKIAKITGEYDPSHIKYLVYFGFRNTPEYSPVAVHLS